MGTTAGWRGGAILANLAALATASAVHAQTRIIYVDDDAVPSEQTDGTSWDRAFNDLRDALWSIPLGAGLVLDEVEIRIAQGTYVPDKEYRGVSFDFRGSVVSGVALTVLGGFAGLGAENPDIRDPARFVTVLSGDLKNNDTQDPATWRDNSYQIATARSVSAFLMDGLTFQGGRGVSEHGTGMGSGALLMSSRNINIEPRTARETDPVIRNCRFIDNITGYAAGVLVCASGEAQLGIHVEDCDFIANRSLDEDEWSGGGAAWVAGGIVVIDRCRFIDNSTEGRGGAVAASPGASVHIRDSLFVNNSAKVEGGALHLPGRDYIYQSPAIVERCTFTTNLAPRGSDITSGPIQVMGCILHDDQAGFTESRIHALDATENSFNLLTFEHTNLQGGQGAITGDVGAIRWLGGNLDIQPRYDALFGLAEDSPCIDAGSPRTLNAHDRDVRGLARVFDGNGDGVACPDMGASEWQLAPCSADFDGSGFVDTDDFDAFMRAFEAGC